MGHRQSRPYSLPRGCKSYRSICSSRSGCGAPCCDTYFNGRKIRNYECVPFNRWSRNGRCLRRRGRRRLQDGDGDDQGEDDDINTMNHDDEEDECYTCDAEPILLEEINHKYACSIEGRAAAADLDTPCCDIDGNVIDMEALCADYGIYIYIYIIYLYMYMRQSEAHNIILYYLNRRFIIFNI